MRSAKNRLRTIAKAALPPAAFRSLRRSRDLIQAWRRDLVFRRAMKRFLDDPAGCLDADDTVLRDLVHGWGNNWSAQTEYLRACVNLALSSRGPILECGSGLSTVLVGVVAKRRGLVHWSLEHSPEWAEKVRRCLNRYQLDTIVPMARPLKDYGEFSWYDSPLPSMPDRFALVICDGPPGETKGGRYGLAPLMGHRLEPGAIVLLDDADREPELAVARRWQAELGGELQIQGVLKPYIQMTVDRG